MLESLEHGATVGPSGFWTGEAAALVALVSWWVEREVSRPADPPGSSCNCYGEGKVKELKMGKEDKEDEEMLWCKA